MWIYEQLLNYFAKKSHYLKNLGSKKRFEKSIKIKNNIKDLNKLTKEYCTTKKTFKKQTILFLLEWEELKVDS